MLPFPEHRRLRHPEGPSGRGLSPQWIALLAQIVSLLPACRHVVPAGRLAPNISNLRTKGNPLELGESAPRSILRALPRVTELNGEALSHLGPSSPSSHNRKCVLVCRASPGGHVPIPPRACSRTERHCTELIYMAHLVLGCVVLACLRRPVTGALSQQSSLDDLLPFCLLSPCSAGRLRDEPQRGFFASPLLSVERALKLKAELMSTEYAGGNRELSCLCACGATFRPHTELDVGHPCPGFGLLERSFVQSLTSSNWPSKVSCIEVTKQRLESVPNLASLSNLRKVDLSHNKITSLQVKALEILMCSNSLAFPWIARRVRQHIIRVAYDTA